MRKYIVKDFKDIKCPYCSKELTVINYGRLKNDNQSHQEQTNHSGVLTVGTDRRVSGSQRNDKRLGDSRKGLCKCKCRKDEHEQRLNEEGFTQFEECLNCSDCEKFEEGSS